MALAVARRGGRIQGEIGLCLNVCVIHVIIKMLKGRVMLGDTEVCTEGPKFITGALFSSINCLVLLWPGIGHSIPQSQK